MNKVTALDANTIFELEDKLNEFGKTHEVFSTQIFHTTNLEYWSAMVYWKEKQSESIIPEKKIEKFGEQKKSQLATEKQIYFLKKAGYKGNFDSLTKKEAFALITEIKGDSK